MSKRVLFITGGTGFLGRRILQLALRDSEVLKIYLLVRAPNEIKLKAKIDDVYRDINWDGDDFNESLRKIKIVHGDLDSISRLNDSSILSQVTDIFHCAALLSFNSAYRESYQTNYKGTEFIIDFANKCQLLRKLNFVGTVFIAGRYEGIFSEHDFNCKQSFNNPYEETKFLAEEVIRKNFNQNYSTLIFRPSIVMGDSLTGKSKNFNVIYKPLHLFSKQILDLVPANINTEHNLIPVDKAAEAIYLLSQTQFGNKTFHIINPSKTVCGDFFSLAEKFFGFKNPKFIPVEKFDFNQLTKVQFNLLKPYLPYYNYKTHFKGDYTFKILESLGFHFPVLKENYYQILFDYCKKSGLVKATF